MKKKTVLAIFIVLSSLVLGSFIFKSDVSAYDCRAMGMQCQAPHGSFTRNVWQWYRTFYCYKQTWRVYYRCYGNDRNCTGGHYYYRTSADCWAKRRIRFAGCCEEISCTPGCTPPACPSGTSASGTGDLYTPRPSCRDDCGDRHYRNCWYDCTDPTCQELNSELYDVCPGGQTCGGPVTITYTDSVACGGATHSKQCVFVRNSRPVSTDLTIYYGDFGTVQGTHTSQSPWFNKIVKSLSAQELEGGVDRILGFTSTEYSGSSLNNPIKIRAEYQDADGSNDIVAIYVWWSESETVDFITPDRIAAASEGLSSQSESEDSWGFMLRRVGGSWTTVYSPYISSTDAAWVEIGYAGGGSSPSSILSPSGEEMAVLHNIEVTDISGGRVEIELLLEFVNSGTSPAIAEGEYKIWNFANDVDGFLPFESDPDIEDVIVDNDLWEDSTMDWNLDLEEPSIWAETISEVSDGVLALDFNVSDIDNFGLSYVRIDACRTGGSTTDVLTPTLNGVPGSSYTMPTCDACSSFSGIDITSDLDLLGGDGTILSSTTHTYSPMTLRVALNSNENGAITFWITAMDMAGNYQQSTIIYELGKWMIATDGFVYGTDGVSANTRNIADGVWNAPSELFNYNFDEPTADLTDLVLLGGHNNTASFLGMLVKYNENNSFKVAHFPGVYINSPYTELLAAYNAKTENLLLDYDEISDTSISGNLTSLFGAVHDYYIVNNSGDTTISSSFVCDGQGLIMVDGDITITPDVVNSTALDACIVLASGDIIIEDGSNKTDSGAFGYDLLHAFLIANGEIIIDADAHNDGLLVEGGLVAFTPNTASGAIVNNREMDVATSNIYPILAVNNNAKYGLLSKVLFGSQIDVFKLEIGFKPY